MAFKTFRLKIDFGFLKAGRLLKQDVSGNYFAAQTDDEFLANAMPWIGSVKLQQNYVENDIKTILEELDGSSHQNQEGSTLKPILFTNIKWDTNDQPDSHLPKDVGMNVPVDCDLDLEGADLLSNKYGYCVLSFDWTDGDVESDDFGETFDEDVDQMRSWSISCQLAAVPGAYLEQVPSEVAALITAAKNLHPEMARGALKREFNGEPCPVLG